MKKILFTILLSLFLVKTYAQDSLQVALQKINKETKFGLAMSGGGAKGFAHIGILKIIDSLGIKVDYITGTSMGGIMGGLYAMGYSGEEIKKRVYTVDWGRILSNRIPYSKVNISEKDEYDRYIIEFPVVNGFPTLPSSYIEGQYMSEVLNTLTFNSKHINDFSKLRIPVELTSSDIVNGGLIMQKKGSLPQAIRATLAIPAAFSPVYIDGKLLVDGGLDRNYPANEVQEMGANFIIGGYTGFRLFTKKEIENPLKMIYQTHAIHSVEDFKYQKQLSNILVNFVGPLGELTTSDFSKYKEIIKIGEDEARKHLPEFIALAEAQKKLGIIPDHKMIEEVKKPTIKITYSEDNGTPLTDDSEIMTIKSLMDLKEGEYFDSTTLNEAIDRAFGIRLYEKIYYTYTDSDQGLILNIFVKRAKKGAFKLALHYDTEQSVGIIVNYTYRNIASNKSRLLATLDISERFKARVHFQKFLNNKYRFWLGAEAKYSNMKSNDLLLKYATIFSDGNSSVAIPDYDYNNFTSNIALNYNIQPNALAAIGIEYNNEIINRKMDKISQSYVDNYSKKLYGHDNFAVFIKLNQNTFNKRYYFTKGNNLQVNARYYFGNQYNLHDLKTTLPDLYEILNPESDSYFKHDKILSLTLNESYALAINKTLTVKFNAFIGAI